MTSAWAKKSCLIADSDLEVYFSNIGIIVPNLPSDEILPVLESLLEPNIVNGVVDESPPAILMGLRTAVHLLMCWTAKIQRLFTTFASSESLHFLSIFSFDSLTDYVFSLTGPGISANKLAAKVKVLWTVSFLSRSFSFTFSSY